MTCTAKKRFRVTASKRPRLAGYALVSSTLDVKFGGRSEKTIAVSFWPRRTDRRGRLAVACRASGLPVVTRPGRHSVGKKCPYACRPGPRPAASDANGLTAPHAALTKVFEQRQYVTSDAFDLVIALLVGTDEVECDMAYARGMEGTYAVGDLLR